MRAKTDVEAIRRIAGLLLEMPIEVDSKFEFICHHPFIRDTYTPVPCEKTEENPVGIDLLDARDEANLVKIKSFIKMSLDKCTKASDFFLTINKPYSGIFFKLIKDSLNIDDYTNILEHIWVSTEYPNTDCNVSKTDWIDYWKHADLSKIYSDDDKRLIDKLPNELVVYRGLMQGASVKALSWTLDIEKAKWFAKRFNNQGKVYSAKCNKKDMLVYLSCRGESEIVVDYRKLKDIKEVTDL